MAIFREFDNQPVNAAAAMPTSSTNTYHLASSIQVTKTDHAAVYRTDITNQALGEKYDRMMSATTLVNVNNLPDSDTEWFNSHDTDRRTHQQQTPTLPKPADHEQRHIVHNFLRQLEDPNHSRCFLYLLTGPPGTGKSNVIKLLQDAIGNNQTMGPIVPLAFFGIAAINVDGTTLSSVIQHTLPSDDDSNVQIAVLNSEHMAKFCNDLSIAPDDPARNVSMIVIDEISTVSPVILAILSERLKQATAKVDPFGGIPMLLAGDFSQLPPVANVSLAHGMMDLKIHEIYHEREVKRLLSEKKRMPTAHCSPMEADASSFDMWG